MKVLLLKPPFAQALYGSIEMSNISALLQKNNFDVKVLYADLLFRQKFLLFNYYDQMVNSSNFLICGEYIFASAAFPELEEKHAEIDKLNQFEKIDKPTYMNSNYRETSFKELKYCKSSVQWFLDTITSLIKEINPDIIGFDITAEQINASIAIANRIKKEKAGIITFMHGYRWMPEIAKELLSAAPSINYIFCGEPELDVLNFCVNARNNQLPDSQVIECKPIKDLDLLPIPDFDEYYKQAGEFGYHYPKILFEAGRGCSWGEKTRCIFCDNIVPFRKKSIDRINEEVLYLSARYKIKRIIFTDQVAGPEFIEKGLVDYKSRGIIESFFICLRSTTGINELKLLKEKGMDSCMSGIETFNSRFLEIISKGTKAADNIRFLRDCLQLSIKVDWNFLFDFPGESESEYRMLFQFLPLLFHLKPPLLVVPLIMCKKNILYKNGTALGIDKIRPFEIVKEIYPPQVDPEIVSYYMYGDYPRAFANPQIKDEFYRIYKQWKSLHENQPPVLKIIQDINKESFIMDTRPLSKVSAFPLEPDHIAILKELSIPRDEQYCRQFADTLSNTRVFQKMLDACYILLIDGFYVSLVTDVE